MNKYVRKVLYIGGLALSLSTGFCAGKLHQYDNDVHDIVNVEEKEMTAHERLLMTNPLKAGVLFHIYNIENLIDEAE